MNYKYLRPFVGVALVTFLYGPSPVLAATAPSLGTAKNFAVLGGSTVTNTGSSVVTGDLGVWPGSAITGFPPGNVSGVIHTTDAVAQQAQSDVTTAYNSLSGQACDANLTGQDLGGKTLTSGVYCFSSSAQLTGTLKLNAQGNPDAVFIFKMGSTLTTASGSRVVMVNGGQSCNVFWRVGTSATIGTTTQLVGNVLALSSITLTTGANLNGRALARNAAVTMDTNNIAAAICGGGGSGGGSCPPGLDIWIADRIIGPPQQIIVGVRDTTSGLKTITVLKVHNATVSIPAFNVGTKQTVFVTVTKINQAIKSSFNLKATNLAGGVCNGDPVITVLKIAPFGYSVRQTFVKIPLAESFVTIVNGNPGLKTLQITVNGARYGRFQLAANQTRNQKTNVDVSSLMTNGVNTITLTGYGDPNASALVVISDSRGNLRFVTPEIWMDWEAGRPDENLVWGNQADQ
jgi:hypothetical protein